MTEIDRFDPRLKIEEASMPPASWYSQPSFFELEKKQVFSKTWQPVARISEIAEPNSYRSGCFAGLPWVITRDEDSQLRGFYNVCSHKGREVVRGSGNAKNGGLVCGYHAWKFGLEGQLKSAPKIAGIKNFDRETMGLTPLKVEEWGHWVFINADLEAKSLKEDLCELTPQLEKRNWTRLNFHSKKSWVINCNWKVYIDNYLDGGYHIPHMHPTLDAQLDMESYKTFCFEKYNVQTSDATAEDQELGYDPQVRIGDGSIYAWLYPNFMINIYGDCLDTNYVVPLDENKCRVDYEFYFLDIKNEDFIRTSIEQSDLTQKEDIEICESVQVGMNSGAYRPGRYAPRIEIGEYQFHQMLHKAYKN